jgi:predicted transcriptional regulator
MSSNISYIANTADIVASYVEKNKIGIAQLPALIQSVHQALTGAASTPAQKTAATATTAAPLKPAVPISSSVTPDYIICLEDGGKFRSLTKHLRSTYNMSPEEYRARWKLNLSYPMTAPNYSAIRSNIAKQNGLGKNGRMMRKGG